VWGDPMMPRPFAAAIALAILGATAGQAQAQARDDTVAILSLEITGDGAPELRDQLRRSLAAGLAAGGAEVVGHDAVTQALEGAPELKACTSTTCLARIRDRVGAARFVRVTIEVHGSAYEASLELLSPEVDGAVVTQLEKPCPVCTIMEVNDVVSSAAKELLRQPVAAPVPVVIETRPALRPVAPHDGPGSER